MGGAAGGRISTRRSRSSIGGSFIFASWTAHLSSLSILLFYRCRSILSLQYPFPYSAPERCGLCRQAKYWVSSRDEQLEGARFGVDVLWLKIAVMAVHRTSTSTSVFPFASHRQPRTDKVGLLNIMSDNNLFRIDASTL